MKILHVCCGFPISARGGVTNYVRSIAIAQSSNGHEVYVLNEELFEGINVIKYKTRISIGNIIRKKDKKSLNKLQEILEKYQFELIHIHMCLTLDWDFVEILKTHKYIVSLHDYFYLCPRIQLTRPGCFGCRGISSSCVSCFSVLERYYFLRRALRKVLGASKVASFPIKDKIIWKNWFNHYKTFLENASVLLPVSNRVKDIYENAGIRNTYKVIHIGNITANSFSKNKVKKHFGKIKLVMLSQFTEIKGGKLLCSIIKKCSNRELEFHFYGRTSDKEKIIMEQNNIINHGQYKQEDLPTILSNMDFGIVVPIWEDNAPQVVMEMLNCGLPVFATNMGGIPDFINQSNGFLFDPFDEQDIDRAVCFLNSLTFDKIDSLKNNIQRTLTPEEHCFELDSLYAETIKEYYKD